MPIASMLRDKRVLRIGPSISTLVRSLTLWPKHIVCEP